MSDPPGIRTIQGHNGSPNVALLQKNNNNNNFVNRSSKGDFETLTINEYDYSSNPNITVTTPTGSIEIVHSQQSSLNSPTPTPTVDENTNINSYSNTNPDLLLHPSPDTAKKESLVNNTTNISDNQENEHHSSSMRFPYQQTDVTSPLSKSSPLSKASGNSISSNILQSPTSGTSVSSPFMNVMNYSSPKETTTPVASVTSPRMNLPLPPSQPPTTATVSTPLTEGSSKRNISPLKLYSTGSIHSQVASKAQKFSSLKKRKQQGHNALLNRLFCNNAYTISSNNSLVEEDDNNNNNLEQRSQPSVNSGGNSSSGDDTNPQANTPKFKNFMKDVQLPVEITNCVQIGTSIIEQASESLTLHEEDKVRADIQSNLMDTMDVVCASTNVSSPPTYTSTNKVSSFLSKSPVVRTASIKTSSSSVQFKFKSSNSNSDEPYDEVRDSIKKSVRMSSSKNHGSVSDDDIVEPKMKLSNDYDDELAETLSQPTGTSFEVKSNTIGEITKAHSSDDAGGNMKTPGKYSKGSKPMKTPGGLVIPSPFTHNSGKGLFPSTFGGTPSYIKPTTTSKISPLASARKLSTSSRKDTNKQQQHPIPIVYIPEMATTSSTSTTVATSTVTTDQSPPQHQFHSSSPDRIEKERTSPILVRITSSLEDLETVPEVTTSKEIDETTTTTSATADGIVADEANQISNNVKTLVTNKDGNTTVLDKTMAAPTNTEQLHQRVSKSPIPNENASRTNYSSIDELKAQYERKLSEQKDQIALANRVAKMRLDEIERLEAVMDSFKERQSNTDEISRLKDRLQQFQQEKKKDIEKVRKEVQIQYEQQNQDWIQEKCKFQSMEEELLLVKAQLTELETMARPMITLVPSNDEVERLRADLVDAKAALLENEKNLCEMTSLREQLDLCKRELNAANAISDTANQSIEVQMSTETERLQLQNDLITVNEKLVQVTAELAQKEKELSKANALTASKKSESPSRSAMSQSRYASPRTTPVRGSASKARPRTSISETASSKSAIKLQHDTKEMFEREKETLREQIELLKTQALETSREHERALEDLRTANELEIKHIKEELENKLQHHKMMEQELKESLSAASSSEREELLEQIELLQAEKKLDQLSGLRDVQKREELLQRISTLEQKDKLLIESHERAISELKVQSEVEINKLRKELQSQEEMQQAREKEIEAQIKETHSFEKNTLQAKIDNLENQLESERSGSVLLGIKLSNMEKDFSNAELLHRDALQAQKVSLSDEMQRLQTELNDRIALEQAMQIATNERDAFEEELLQIKVKFDDESRQFNQRIEEIKKVHQHDKAAAITKLQNDFDEKCKHLDVMSQKKFTDMKADYDSKIESLIKCHAEEIGNLRKEMNAADENYKVLLTESNALFESYQRDAESKIAVLNEKLEAALNHSDQNEDQDLRKKYEELQKIQSQHESQLKAAEESHNKHFEDLLAQLDLVEAEQQQATAAKEKALVEKDAIVDALGSQLAEAHRKISDAQAKITAVSNESEINHKACQALESQVESLKDEIRELKNQNKKFIKEAEIKREKACEEAREEMIEKAEIQFQQANEHYVKLRKQYDEAQDRAKKFENELKLLKKRIEKLNQEKENNEIDLKAEIAQLHAANAKIEAESAQKAKEYRRELERLLQTAKIFEAKAEEASSTSRSIQTTLATVVAEKQKLQLEYEEMKSVSEELMAIVEGNGSGEQRTT